jgi:hypothetical protein
MHLIYNDEFRRFLNKYLTALIGFDVVQGDDLIGIVIIDTTVALDFAVKTRLGIGTNNDSINPKFIF